jgi:mannose-6-phosphate isomerase-like protein (cupin superfamily)
MQAGDCVLQPPQIRHRVLESSAGLEVIEIGCPAMHETRADHAMSLPTARVMPLREFERQRFVRHVATVAAWVPWRWLGREASGFEARDIGIAAATWGLAGARVVRADAGARTSIASHDGELLFLFVLSGSLQLQSVSPGEHALHAGDSVTIPAGVEVSLRVSSPVEFLEVALPVG